MLTDLLELCKSFPPQAKLYIQTHNFPDPDAIASSFGLQMLLREYGIESTLCYEGRIDKVSTAMMLDLFDIEIFEYDQLRETMNESDPIICVDSQKMGGNITDFIGDEIACIDHHPVYVEPDYKYSDLRITGACASIIAEYWQQSAKQPDTNTATALLYGMKMDTASFSRGVTLFDIDMYRYLFPLASQDALSVLEHNSLELKDLSAYGTAIEKIGVFEKIGFSFIPFSCPDGLIASVSDFILSLMEVEISIIYSKREDGYKFSVRSEIPEIDAGNLVRTALDGIGSGGGHASMAGGFVKMAEIERLGQYPDDALRARFLNAWEDACQKS